MNKMVDIYINTSIKPDIATNKINYTFPDGYGLELINYKTLMWCNNNIKDQYNRELIVQWIINNPNKFKIISMENDINYSNYGLCVDTPEDLIYIKNIFKLLSLARKYLPNELSIIAHYCNFLKKCSGKYKESEELFELGMTINPCDSDHLGAYAQFMFKVRGNTDRANNLFLKAIEADPIHWHNLSRYANMLKKTGKNK